MEFRILGHLEVVRGSRRLELGGPKQRAVLAALVLEPNSVVPLYRLLDQLWGEEPPPRATATLQAYVSNLRRILEPERRPRAPATVLMTQAPGYLLRVDPGRVDFLVFRALATKGRQLLVEGKPRAAREAFTESLALWRGHPLGDLPDERFSQLTATRLEDERLDVLEGEIDADLALGQHAAIIPELEHLVTEHPYRERFWYQLLLSMYRAGRQADALSGFQRVRALFSEDLGIDPSASCGRSKERSCSSPLLSIGSLPWKRSRWSKPPAGKPQNYRCNRPRPRPASPTSTVFRSLAAVLNWPPSSRWRKKSIKAAVVCFSSRVSPGSESLAWLRSSSP